MAYKSWLVLVFALLVQVSAGASASGRVGGNPAGAAGISCAVDGCCCTTMDAPVCECIEAPEGEGSDDPAAPPRAPSPREGLAAPAVIDERDIIGLARQPAKAAGHGRCARAAGMAEPSEVPRRVLFCAFLI